MKVIVERETGKILGASILIQEIINAMTVELEIFRPWHEECIFTLPCQR